VDLRIHESYAWLLVPTQEGTNPVEWEATRIAGGGESFVIKASKKLKSSEQLISRWSPALLRMELDRWLWKDASHLSVKKLWDYLARYVYLPRLRDAEVLMEAIKDGAARRDYFAYATAVSDDGRYQGLMIGGLTGHVYMDEASVLVKPEAGQKQIDDDTAAREAAAASKAAGTTPHTGKTGPLAVKNGIAMPLGTSSATVPADNKPRRFHGTVTLDATRVSRDAGRIYDEVIHHLVSQLGAEVEVTLEIHARLPGGASDNVVRTVTENAKTLKFDGFGFEND